MNNEAHQNKILEMRIGLKILEHLTIMYALILFLKK